MALNVSIIKEEADRLIQLAKQYPNSELFGYLVGIEQSGDNYLFPKWFGTGGERGISVGSSNKGNIIAGSLIDLGYVLAPYHSHPINGASSGDKTMIRDLYRTHGKTIPCSVIINRNNGRMFVYDNETAQPVRNFNLRALNTFTDGQAESLDGVITEIYNTVQRLNRTIRA